MVPCVQSVFRVVLVIRLKMDVRGSSTDLRSDVWVTLLTIVFSY